MHIAIIRLSSMGDIVIQTSWVSWLKSIHPQMKISFVTLRTFKGLIDEHPCIDQVIYIDRLKGRQDIKALWDLSLTLNSQCDFMIDLHGTLRSWMIRLFCWKVPALKAYKRSFLRWLLVYKKWDLLKNLSSQHFRTIEDMAFLLDKKFDRSELQGYLRSITNRPYVGVTSLKQTFMEHHQQKKICLSPVASFASKRWPMKFVKALILEILDDPELVDYSLVLVAGPQDSYVQEAIPEELKSSSRLLNLQGKTSLQQTVEFIDQCEVCVSNDTGTTHIAEALGIPVVSIFGSTSESFGFKPHLESSIALSTNDVSCRPCSTTGKKICSQLKHLCVEAVSVKIVMQNLKKRLRGNNTNV